MLRKLSPILSDISSLYEIKAKMEKGGLDALSNFLSKATKILSGMSDAEAESILIGLLSSVSLKSTNIINPLVVGDCLQYQSMELKDMLTLSYHAITLNFSSFFDFPQANSMDTVQIEKSIG